MDDALQAANRKAEATYNAASDHFDSAPLAFWERYGRRTVERLSLPRAGHILDVCCGAGASALPAATIFGVAKAAAAGLRNMEFRRADMIALDFSGARIRHSAFNPWDRITTPDVERKLFADAGFSNVEVSEEEGFQPLLSPEDFWTIALGSGLRWAIDQMGAEKAAVVKNTVIEKLTADGIDKVATNVIYAVARVDQD